MCSLDFQQTCKGNSSENKMLFSTSGAETINYPMQKSMNVDPYVIQYIKIN